MFDPVLPFVLLDDAARGRARLFTGLAETVEAVAPGEVGAALERLRTPGPWAGFVGFEAGYAIEPALAPLARGSGDDLPLVWFGRFAREEILDRGGIDALLGQRRGSVGDLTLCIAPAAHAAMVERIHALIAAGDVYQVNATFAAIVAAGGHPLSLYRRLRLAQAAPCGALIHTGAAWILSFSPELFFTLAEGRLTARPMKGTAPRGLSAADDDAAALALAADPKNRAENLMIVDLLRNDLSRVADHVETPALFEIERYPTVLQMTSTVTATARPGAHAVDVLEALFPCGSVTGAPKIRAMEAIAEVEAAPRGLYTGSIGAIDANGNAAFNVAIRTLVLAGGSARLGLGGGIVADSVAAEEWNEALAKAAFLARSGRVVDLIETMYASPDGIRHRALHMARLAASARRLGMAFDSAAADARLDAAVAALGAPARLRLLLATGGALSVQASPLPANPTEPVQVALAPLPLAPSDWRLAHKTTDRGFYDDARRASGAFEVLFVRPDGRLTEGSFTNLFVERSGRLLTPPAHDGLLSGILRAALLAEGRAVEADLTPADLAGGFWIGNSLRGLLRARLVAAPSPPA